MTHSYTTYGDVPIFFDFNFRKDVQDTFFLALKKNNLADYRNDLDAKVGTKYQETYIDFNRNGQPDRGELLSLPPGQAREILKDHPLDMFVTEPELSAILNFINLSWQEGRADEEFMREVLALFLIYQYDDYDFWLPENRELIESWRAQLNITEVNPFEGVMPHKFGYVDRSHPMYKYSPFLLPTIDYDPSKETLQKMLEQYDYMGELVIAIENHYLERALHAPEAVAKYRAIIDKFAAYFAVKDKLTVAEKQRFIRTSQRKLAKLAFQEEYFKPNFKQLSAEQFEKLFKQAVISEYIYLQLGTSYAGAPPPDAQKQAIIYFPLGFIRGLSNPVILTSFVENNAGDCNSILLVMSDMAKAIGLETKADFTNLHVAGHLPGFAEFGGGVNFEATNGLFYTREFYNSRFAKNFLALSMNNRADLPLYY